MLAAIARVRRVSSRRILQCRDTTYGPSVRYEKVQPWL